MALSDEMLQIATPENVVFDYEVAGLGSRFLAALLDTLLILVLQIANVMLFVVASGVLANGGGNVQMWLLAAAGLLAFALLWGYYVLFETIWNGQSPGKRWTGLRVIRTDGTPIGLVEAIIRNLVRLVDFLPLYYGIGIVTMFVNPQARRLGDLAAGTLVVRDRPSVTLESLAAGPALGVPPQLAGVAWPVERLTSRDLQLAEEFLRRRGELVLASRRDIAWRIAPMLIARMALPANWLQLGWDPELIIAAVVQARHSRESIDR
jgi:uncharacterized RDD family membrane protein YckC